MIHKIGRSNFLTGLFATFCSAIQCPTPEISHHASMSVNSTRLGSRVVYECEEGYVVTEGDRVIECLSNGTWDGQKPTCESR